MNWNANIRCEVCQEKVDDWARRFGAIGITCRELTGDTDTSDLAALNSADIICTTPEKFGEDHLVALDRGCQPPILKCTCAQ